MRWTNLPKPGWERPPREGWGRCWGFRATWCWKMLRVDDGCWETWNGDGPVLASRIDGVADRQPRTEKDHNGGWSVEIGIEVEVENQTATANGAGGGCLGREDRVCWPDPKVKGDGRVANRPGYEGEMVHADRRPTPRHSGLLPA